MKYIQKEISDVNWRDTGGCVARAIHIATDIPYKEIHSTLTLLGQLEGTVGYAPRNHKAHRSNPSKGMNILTYTPYLKTLGWIYRPLPKMMLLDFLPHTGTIMIHFYRHLATAIDGIIYDNWDCRKLKIIGYYRKEILK